MRIVSIVGARPEFIQAAPVSRVLRRNHEEILVHTGQHYDYRMSQVFFEHLSLPEPDVNLDVGSGPHGQQTAEMVARLEHTFIAKQPDLVIVRGDTNSTLAGALAAAKLGIPLAHIEAGERSYNKRMPEEINRLVADRLADALFCVTRSAVNHLADEGIVNGVSYTGDVMLDALQQNHAVARRRSTILSRLGLDTDGYLLATVHRAGNTDDPDRLRGILTAFNSIREQIVFPIHPRTQSAIQRLGLALAPNVQTIDPVGYLDMLMLESHARMILTDSGGVQREAYFLSIPCITLREETELMETVKVGWNRLAGADPDRILTTAREFIAPAEHPPLFGDGRAAERIGDILNAAPIAFGQNYDRAIVQMATLSLVS
ncbi:MAG TPA: UDP-N-acetylglucosamine 2-epimerase (non-hydrolyzing) [Anaerolineae bacterium]|nr:UDP-N-acetylglucosamine 2-epimerase (non-hydrolyzing) [Anaerolineae bacterium]